MDYGFAVIEKAIENSTEDKLFLRWVTGGYDKQIPFKEFRGYSLAKTKQNNQSAEEIINKIKSLFEGGDNK